jgi:hypothetical protein
MTDEDSPASIGWPAVCPGLQNGGCTNPIADCGDVVTCLQCMADVGGTIVLGFTYGPFVVPSTDDKVLNRCQATIGTAVVKFQQAKSKALLKCWDARLRGKHANACPNPGDGKAAAAIAKAEAKKQQAVCKACGGPDQACDGVADLTPSAIGTFPNCYGVVVPGGADCGAIGALDDLSDLVACVDCVTEAIVDCVDRAQVPANAAYPAVCNPCEGGSPGVCGGICPTGLMCATVPGPPPFFDPPVCGCVPDGSQPCASSWVGLCNGTCPAGEQCGSLGINGLSQCGCGDPPCGDAIYPTCGGDCPVGQECIPGTAGSFDFCICVTAGNVCTQVPMCTQGTCPPSQVCNFVNCSCEPE